MNANEQILAELKRIAAWADMQRRLTKWSVVFVAIFIPAAIVFSVVMENRLKRSLENTRSPQEHSWYDVDRNLRSGNIDNAVQIGQELIKKTPLSPDSHTRLANAYLTKGDLTNAVTHYREAVRLFPSKNNQELLTAATQRIEQENPQPTAPAYGAKRADAEPRRSTNGKHDH